MKVYAFWSELPVRRKRTLDVSLFKRSLLNLYYLYVRKVLVEKNLDLEFESDDFNISRQIFGVHIKNSKLHSFADLFPAFCILMNDDMVTKHF